MKGKTPVVSSTAAKFGLNLIVAVSAQGEFRFMTVRDPVGATQFIGFIKRLLHSMTGMVFLIVDGHRAHHAKMMKKFVESVKDRFRHSLVFPYSADLNPDERVWSDLKNNAVGRQSIGSPEQLKGAIIGHAQSMENCLNTYGHTLKAKQQDMRLNGVSMMGRLIFIK